MKISRYSKAIDNIVRAFKSKKDELIVTVSIFAISILIASILMYIVENPVQPEAFSSIPKCFYFSIITFTSVGYGDISPISDLGKMLASLLATIGVGFHGLLIGIFSVAMIDAFIENGKLKDNEKGDN
jgi:voltage-gated potassium channel